MEYVEFEETSTNNPQLTLRMLDRGMSVNSKGKQDAKDMDNIFGYINKMEYEIKSFSVGGIPGIKSVKTSKRLVMNPPESSKTNLDK